MKTKVKSVSKVKRDNPSMVTLINAVISQLGSSDDLGYIRDASDGYSGFIYYNETHAFTIKHRAAILELLNETADQLGEDVVTMVCNFGVFRRDKASQEDKKDLYIFLGGGKPTQGPITNVLAWFTLEEVNRLFED